MKSKHANLLLVVGGAILLLLLLFVFTRVLGKEGFYQGPKPNDCPANLADMHKTSDPLQCKTSCGVIKLNTTYRLPCLNNSYNSCLKKSGCKPNGTPGILLPNTDPQYAICPIDIKRFVTKDPTKCVSACNPIKIYTGPGSSCNQATYGACLKQNGCDIFGKPIASSIPSTGTSIPSTGTTTSIASTNYKLDTMGCPIGLVDDYKTTNSLNCATSCAPILSYNGPGSPCKNAAYAACLRQSGCDVFTRKPITR